jgi:membrane peptidoglycan carboxypeptidase
MTDDQVEWRTGRGIQRVGPKLPGWVSLADAGWMPEAVIAAEDIRFRTHPGFDLVAIQEALEAAPREVRVRGGSTITQQLAKNLFFDGRRTLRRKLRELLVALALEERMSKDGILALYLNVVNFGPGIRGVGAAADAWFLKAPGQLSPREAAFLASILPAPNMWHRRITETGKPPVRRVDEVLDRMRIRGVLTKAEHGRERARRLRIVPPYGHESE